MLYYLMIKVEVKVDPEVKVRSHPLRSSIELEGQVASIDRFGSSDGAFFLTIYINLIGSY